MVNNASHTELIVTTIHKLVTNLFGLL